MDILPPTAIQQDDNAIAGLCRQSGEPVSLTQNGTNDLVAMDMEPFHRRKLLLKLKEELIGVEERRLAGAKYYTLEEVETYMDAVIAKTIPLPHFCVIP